MSNIYKQCPKCGAAHTKSGTFCSRPCANSRGPRTDDFKQKVREKLSIKLHQQKELLEEAINSSATMTQAASKIGMPFMTFKRKAEALRLYVPNQGARGTVKPYRGSNKIDLQEIIAGNHTQYGTNKLKKRLIKDGYLKHICVGCGLTDTWNGKPITLHLDHINGVHNDHRLDNLRLLCPNCHSQTDTWCGRNKKTTAS